MALNNKLYDSAKYTAQVVLPAVGTLYFALAQIWHLPSATEVVGTITAVDTFLGVALHIQNVSYNNSDEKYDGAVVITETPDKKTYSLNLKGEPEEIDTKNDILLKVDTPPAA